MLYGFCLWRSYYGFVLQDIPYIPRCDCWIDEQWADRMWPAAVLQDRATTGGWWLVRKSVKEYVDGIDVVGLIWFD